jgi:hypothetical protein
MCVRCLPENLSDVKFDPRALKPSYREAATKTQLEESLGMHIWIVPQIAGYSHHAHHLTNGELVGVPGALLAVCHAGRTSRGLGKPSSFDVRMAAFGCAFNPSGGYYQRSSGGERRIL